MKKFCKFSKTVEFTLRPIHLAASVLDPKCNGNNLRLDEYADAVEYIHNRACHLHGEESQMVTDIMTDLALYQNNENQYGKPYVQKTIKTLDPITWWKVNFVGTPLSSIATDILGMLSTTAATERSFSTFGNVCTAKRNRLLFQRSGKLTFFSHNLKLMFSDKSIANDSYQITE